MNDASMQDSLFPDPLGTRLRAAREKAGLTTEQVGAQLRLPVAIVEAMEREDWARLGAPVYIRSYLGSYLRLLGLPAALQSLAKVAAEEPPLVTLAPTSRMRHTLDRSLRNVVYLVMTAVLVVPVVYVARHYQARERVEELTLETEALPAADIAASDAASPPAGAPPSASALPPTDDTLATAAPATDGSTSDVAPVGGESATGSGPDPVMASMAPFPKATAPGALVLTFHGESWIDVVGPDGSRVERGLVAAGTERTYRPGEVARITLGNADGVDVEHGGRDIDLTPFRSANVARFAVSSDGAPAPAAN
jgi:cytoskeleton protein RodZ